jgi:gamma-glutamyltranspeptidase/glutathione hydrolase
MVQWYGAFRPAIMGGRAMVSSTHYLATAAGVEILKTGGNAVDAGVAVGLCINVLEPHLTTFGGVAPIMTWDAAARRVETISGLGRWPAAIAIDWYQQNFGGDMPEGIARTVTPAAAAWLDALARGGTMTFARVVAPALALAEGGFPVYPRLAATFAREAATVAGWPASAETFLPGGRPPREREIWRQPALAATFRRLCEAERGAANREAGLAAARRRFYEGDLAEAMARHSAAEGGLLTGDDLARFRVGHEAPVSAKYGEYEVFACGPWCQGPVIPQALGILAGDDLAALGHNSADYLHLVAEALKLAFADRERFYGDPDFVTVPLDGLLSPGYAAARRAQIDPARAWAELPPSGDPRPFMSSGGRGLDVSARRPAAIAAPTGPDTAYCCVVDAAGNAFSATPSDSALSAPFVPGLGIPLSTRGSQGWLDPAHPSAVAPNKRPRLTPNPALALRAGELFMPFGCPGGDGQTQAMLQVFLNVAAFGMNLQRAIEEPRVISESFPDSFWPHGYAPGRLNVEGRIAPAVRAELARRGHRVNDWGEWHAAACSVCAIVVDPATGTRIGGADPRRECYALGF